MSLRGYLAVVGDLAHVPQFRDCGGPADHVEHFAVLTYRFERDDILGHPRAGQTIFSRERAQAVPQCIDGRKIELPIAPLKDLHRVEGMSFEPFNEVIFERLDVTSDAERAIVHVPTGAARDLRQLGRREIPMVLPVELADRGERDMVHRQVEPHAYGVRRHEEVDIARLVHRHLRIARSWR